VAALQELPPKQRAALLLVDVLGFSVAETAEILELSEDAVASALQRAASRRGLRRPTREADPAVVARYVDAFERYDVDALKTLLREDVVLSMPPLSLWLSGPEVVGTWLLGRGIGCKGSRLVATRACGMPAFGQYRASEAGFSAWSLIVLDIDGDGRIAAMTHFLDTEALFPRFGLSSVLAEQPLRL
jgi:RNA polymerase sigma-70 factor (ECF subfamily)